MSSPKDEDAGSLPPLLQHYFKHAAHQLSSSSHSRTVFNLCTIHARRDASRITAVAIDAAAQRLFLGLANG